MDKLQAMSVFVRIAEQNSLSAAANILGKSLPAVVRTLAALEEELHIRLFNRTTRHIALTDEGRVYLEHCRRILADINETERLLSNHQSEPTGSITITAPVQFGQLYVLPAITRFMQRYPRVQINLQLFDRVVGLLEEGVDFAIRIAPLADSMLVAKSIGSIRRVICASPKLVKKGGEPKHPGELIHHPCMRFTGISEGSVWQFLENGNIFSVRVAGNLLCNNIASLISACVLGMGFGVFYSYQVMPYVRNRELKIVLEQYELPPLPVSLVFQQRQLDSNRFRLFADFIVQELHESLAADTNS